MTEPFVSIDSPATVQTIAQWFIDHLLLGVLVLTRLSTLLMAMPSVGVGIPRRVRAMLALLVTMLLLPAVAARAEVATLPGINNLVELSIAIAREGLIGMLIGATIQFLITGLQLAGEAITSTGGMQLGDAVDPTTSSNMSSIARLVGLMVTAVMLAVGGHRIMLSVLLDSFQAMPPGRVEFRDSMMALVVDELATGMAAGVRVAAPVLAALLLSNLITGLISRTLPQINVLAIGLSINAMALMVVTALTVGSAGLIFQEELAVAVARISALW